MIQRRAALLWELSRSLSECQSVTAMGTQRELVMTGYPVHCVRQQCDLCPTSAPLLRLKLLQPPPYVLISQTVSFPNVPLFVLRFMLVSLSNSSNWNHEIIFTIIATCRANPYLLIRVQTLLVRSRFSLWKTEKGMEQVMLKRTDRNRPASPQSLCSTG